MENTTLLIIIIISVLTIIGGVFYLVFMTPDEGVTTGGGETGGGETGGDRTTGCTDPNADNYCCDGIDGAQLSLTDDTVPSSCIYYGCTNPSAVNYNPNANSDNGSCNCGPRSSSQNGVDPVTNDCRCDWSTTTPYEKPGSHQCGEMGAPCEIEPCVMSNDYTGCCVCAFGFTSTATGCVIQQGVKPQEGAVNDPECFRNHIRYLINEPTIAGRTWGNGVGPNTDTARRELWSLVETHCQVFNLDYSYIYGIKL
tara:strand:+ start:661 stop:1422 length:762 start_codon:yes stop_codon:yes gene_type:complete